MRFEVEIEEKVTYRHTVTVEADCEEDVDYALNSFEENAYCREDIYDYLTDNNVKTISFCEDDSGEVEFECTDLIKVVDADREEEEADD